MCNRRDFLVRGPAGVGYPTCIALCSLRVYIYINVYRRPRSVGGGGAGGGGGRGNGIELKVTDGSRFPSTVVVTA